MNLKSTNYDVKFIQGFLDLTSGHVRKILNCWEILKLSNFLRFVSMRIMLGMLGVHYTSLEFQGGILAATLLCKCK